MHFRSRSASCPQTRFRANGTPTHRHYGIGLDTAADVHYWLAAAKTAQRSATLVAVRARTPERFTTTADPKILALPGTTWINKPLEKTKTDTEPTTQKKLAA